MAIAAPWAKLFPRKVVSNMKKAGTSVAKAGPGPVIETTRSKIFSDMWPRMITALRVIGASSGMMMWR